MRGGREEGGEGVGSGKSDSPQRTARRTRKRELRATVRPNPIATVTEPRAQQRTFFPSNSTSFVHHGSLNLESTSCTSSAATASSTAPPHSRSSFERASPSAVLCTAA